MRREQGALFIAGPATLLALRRSNGIKSPRHALRVPAASFVPAACTIAVDLGFGVSSCIAGRVLRAASTTAPLVPIRRQGVSHVLLVEHRPLLARLDAGSVRAAPRTA